ncbi:protein phosphatase 1 regulatory subunit 26 [Mugil cephalus]|uniref:protein phosphatase 1 regulatory subunit 26 n=1 Tax=Mugil cephalus TaxID=48193 RepID=UPI001FB7049C|nr:protein phosphatase 1 regulatory subunit 26 [Mugil cephalus]
MYLMNVPPVAATQTEWRACGPPGGYSLPVCFNDSDTELSTRGAPISDKVQMIIESLRSTQSSLEMGDEIEGKGLSGQEGHPQVCNFAVGSYVGAKSETKSPAENRQAHVSSSNNHESSDSDSDDSVDRGIEEAILEYLKEKDDHKRKAEPCPAFLPSPKIPRKGPSVPEVSRQNSDSSAFLIASSQFVKAEPTATPATIPIKKYIKNKASLSENASKNFDSNKNTTESLVCAKEQTKAPLKTLSLFNKAVKFPVKVKVEEDSNDSSSDDGIEEAIQRYQLEKKELQNKREPFPPLAFEEESDSTSDDGIEEAIRCYQLEQLKEKSAVKPFLHKQKPFSKSLMHAVGSASTDNMKKHKLKKKRGRADKEGKSLQPPPSSVFVQKSVLSDCSRGKGNGLHSIKVESAEEQPVPAPPKVNTTAELMCAEAILDISKTVMPSVFPHAVGLGSCTTTESSLQSSPPGNCPNEESNDSSIDSEDGIEQEIRKFLEQKAQLHKQPTQEPPSAHEPEKVKAKDVAIQKKPLKTSITQRRRHKEEKRGVSNLSGMDDAVKETATAPLPEHSKESNSSACSQRSLAHAAAGLRKTDQSGDKSSSLDSDEDLDTAIKDLLKTKKKSKKKTRDLKRKPRKRLRDEEPLLGNALQTKKLKPDPVSKGSALKKVQKSKTDIRDKSASSKNSVPRQMYTSKCVEHEMHEGETDRLKGTQGQGLTLLHNIQAAPDLKEDSSSVDSDDSIEQEIRRFLAEKAKVSTAEKGKDGDASQNGTAAVCTLLKNEDVKQEIQLAEIPRKSVGPLSGLPPLSSAAQDGPQGSPRDVSAVGAQSHLPSVRSRSPSLLEPADGAGAGAGAARGEQRRPVHDVTPKVEKPQPDLSPNAAHSRTNQSIKWRQSLGLPIRDTRAVNRTSFHITSSQVTETPSAATPYQCGGLKLQNVWSSARTTSRAPLPSSAENAANATLRSPVLSIFSTAKQRQRMSFTRGLTPGHRSQCSIEGERESTVHISKDKSVFVELESNRTNHVQVQSRERSQGKERVEGEGVKIESREVHVGRREEEFVDETDCESDRGSYPEKKQGFSTLSLSTAIDPGINISPCIALSTEERIRMFNRKYQRDEKCKKGSLLVRKKALQCVKRKLQFVSVTR